jgi:hypothetical protein
MNTSHWVVAMSTALLSAACSVGCAGEPSVEDAAEAAMASTVDNGLHLNGVHVNGLHVNGLHVNGLHVNGTTLAGASIEGMTLEETSFSGTWNGAQISGLGFIGTRMAARMPDGSTIALRIDDIEPSADPEILLYDVSASADGVSWAPLCVDTLGAPVHSYPLSGYWDESQGTPTGGAHIDDPTQFTFACQGYALAKCTEMGYKPWAAVTECKSSGVCHSVPLSFLHEACTRTLRADYCGDGMPLTRDGTVIDVSDNVGVESFAMPTWPFEAEWSYGGATCIRKTRWSTIDSADTTSTKNAKVKRYIDAHCPDRWSVPKSACGASSSNFYTANGYAVPLTERTLLMTRAVYR